MSQQLMIREAFQFALAHMPAPKGQSLWMGSAPIIAGADVYTPMKDHADRLQAKGHQVFSNYEAVTKCYDAVFVEGTKQQDETEGLLALALQCSKGFVMAAAPNDAGGSRLKRMLQRYGVEVESLAKSRCQIVCTNNAPSADSSLLQQNLQHLALRPLAMQGRDWVTVPGIFGWNKIDPASQFLMQQLPQDVKGLVADFGCGYGYLSTMLIETYPTIHTIDAYDVDARAVACTSRNVNEKVQPVWQDIRDLKALRRYDAIIMNPPFHNGKEEDLELGKTFIRKAWESLRVGGRLFVVANKHLAYEKIIPALKVHYEGDGFKIMTGRV